MGRVVCFDFGRKRIGVAVTDELQIISTPLETVNASEIHNFIHKYISENEVELFVVGLPLDLKGQNTDSTDITKDFINTLKKKYPLIPTETYDERLTSKIARESILAMGKNKKFRRDKTNIDKISASLILQSYLRRKNL